MAYYRDSLGNLLYLQESGYFVDQFGKIYEQSEVGKVDITEDVDLVPDCGVAYVASNKNVVFYTDAGIYDAFTGEKYPLDVGAIFPYKVPYEKGYYTKNGVPILYYNGGLVVLSLTGDRLAPSVLDSCSRVFAYESKPHKYGHIYDGMDGNKHLFTEQGYYEIISGAKNSSFCPEW